LIERGINPSQFRVEGLFEGRRFTPELLGSERTENQLSENQYSEISALTSKRTNLEYTNDEMTARTFDHIDELNSMKNFRNLGKEIAGIPLQNRNIDQIEISSSRLHTTTRRDHD
jgi:hypothetical protein